MDPPILADIHRYWFGDLGDQSAPGEEQVTRWFRPTAEIDTYLRDTYERCLEPAFTTTWDLAALSQPQQVGLVILLDQFPRQMFRDSGRSFAYDEKARGIAKVLVDGGVRRFHPVERTFVYLPLAHSEGVSDQDHSVMLSAAEAVAAPPEAKAWARMALDLATKHRDIIRRFGRFPHRNAMLGRESTPEEVEFLKDSRGY